MKAKSEPEVMAQTCDQHSGSGGKTVPSYKPVSATYQDTVSTEKVRVRARGGRGEERETEREGERMMMNKEGQGAGHVAQLTECLPSIENPGFAPQHCTN